MLQSLWIATIEETKLERERKERDTLGRDAVDVGGTCCQDEAKVRTGA